MTLILDNGMDTGILLDGYWRCGDCLRVWPDSQSGCPCWVLTAEEMDEVERDWRVRNGTPKKGDCGESLVADDA